MFIDSRTVVTLALVCCILPGAESLAIESRPIDLGLLATLVDNPENPVIVDARPSLFPASVFGIAINGKATFSMATEKLGGAVVRKIGEGEAGSRYICYRSMRSNPAVVAIFTSQSPASQDLIDGFAFGLQSGVPSATKVCRDVPWLKAADLHFDRVWLGMTPDKMLDPLRRASSGIHEGKFSVEWHGPWITLASGSGDPASTAHDVVGLSAVLGNDMLVFFHAKNTTAHR